MPKYNISEYMLSRNNFYTLIRKKKYESSPFTNFSIYIIYNYCIMLHLYFHLFTVDWYSIFALYIKYFGKGISLQK